MRAQRTAILLGICISLMALPPAVSAQQTGQSLGDTAKKAKEQQKQAPKGKVWTNDNLPTAATVSVVGQAPPENAAGTDQNQPSQTGESKGASSTEGSNSDLAQAKADLADAQKKLDSLKTDLDIAQRKYKLDSNQFYSGPDYANDLAGQAKLDADTKDIASKQQDVNAAQKDVDDLQKKLDAMTEKTATPPSKS